MLNHGQKPFSVLYEVYETNADLEEVKLVFQCYSSDLAESKMVKLFRQSNYTVDFMILNTEDLSDVELCLTQKTKQLRGECQG